MADLGEGPGLPLILGKKKEEMTEGRKSRGARKSKLTPPPPPPRSSRSRSATDAVHHLQVSPSGLKIFKFENV